MGWGLTINQLRHLWPRRKGLPYRSFIYNFLKNSVINHFFVSVEWPTQQFGVAAPRSSSGTCLCGWLKKYQLRLHWAPIDGGNRSHWVWICDSRVSSEGRRLVVSSYVLHQNHRHLHGYPMWSKARIKDSQLGISISRAWLVSKERDDYQCKPRWRGSKRTGPLAKHMGRVGIRRAGQVAWYTCIGRGKHFQ